MNKVSFEYSNARFEVFDTDILYSWLNKIIINNNKRLKSLSYYIGTEQEILEINRQYLNHDYYTDIITFNQNKFDFIQGDIYISFERIEDFSRETSLNFKDELLRVIAHGCLHLIGFDDKTELDKVEMREQENLAISLYKNEFHKNVPRETK